MRPAGRTQAAPPQRLSPARPETYSSPGTRSGKRRGPRPPRPGSAPPSGEGARRRRRLPVSSSHGSGRAAGSALCAYLPPPSPARLTAAADGRFPGYYNNQQATARSGPLRRRPPPGADNARLRAPTNGVTPARRGAARAQQKNLDFFSPLFLPRP